MTALALNPDLLLPACVKLQYCGGQGPPLSASLQSKKEYKVNPLWFKCRALLRQNPLQGITWRSAGLVLTPQKSPDLRDTNINHRDRGSIKLH